MEIKTVFSLGKIFLSDEEINCHNCPKNRNVYCNIALMHPKDADGLANSVDPDQTASSSLILVCTVC